MRIHSLRLENFRGVRERTIEFPSLGVVIVQGPNEIGKTSMMQALDLLLYEKDSTRKQAVKDAQPVGKDVPVQVSADISAGSYRFTYSKQWLKLPKTQLRIVQPTPESLTGTQAHERVVQILDETVDLELFHALRVLQGKPVDSQVDLKGNTALRAALESASGTAIVEDDGAESLVQAIEAEYLKYFTARGRPTGEYRDTAAEVLAAKEAVEKAQNDIVEIEQHVDRYARLEDELEKLKQQKRDAERSLTEYEKRNQDLERHRAQLATARADFEAAEKHCDHITRTHSDREDLIQARTERAKGAASAEHLHANSQRKVKLAREEHEQAAQELIKVRENVSRIRAEASGIENAIKGVELTEEFEREKKRLAEITAVNARLDEAEKALAANVVTDEDLERIRLAHQEVKISEARLNDAAAQLEVAVQTLEEVTIDGKDLQIRPGSPFNLALTKEISLGFGENISMIITPASGSEERARDCALARENLARVLAAYGVDSLDSATASNSDYRDNIARKSSAISERAVLLGEESESEVRARVSVLEKKLSIDSPDEADELPVKFEPGINTANLTELAALLEDTLKDLKEAEEVETRARNRKEELESELTEYRVDSTRIQTELDAARYELQRAENMVKEAEETITTEQLTAEVGAAKEALENAQKIVMEAEKELKAHDPETVEKLLENARARVERNDAEAHGLNDEMTRLKGALETMGTQGRQDAEDSARTNYEAVQQKYERLDRRARAARLLHETVQHYQQETWQRYVAPFQERITALGRLVFGPSVHFEISPSLEILGRTLDGDPVPFSDLSTGAQEQVGILSRLACAQLVGSNSSVPVLIDDALGNSDPDRLEGMGAALSQAGKDGQVIVLTCTPQRYSDVGETHVIRL